ncbi:MAG: hypothetical protein C0596_11780 [Marinilabiliales bacterium]|nr:MAG: hypothetical protein C0596_11780 [Marinilabiliales bacterium]
MIMKKTALLLSIIAIIFTACTKENVSDTPYSDSISGVKIRYVVNVVDGSANAGKSSTELQNAIVCVVVNDSVYETQVDNNGLAVFNNLFAGNASVHVKCEGYTSANLIVDLKAMPDTTNIYDASNRRIVTSIVNIFPTKGESLANVSGKIYADLDLTDGDLETVSENLNIRAIVNAEDLYKFVDHDCSGGIIDLSYEGFLFSTANSSGNYSLILPAAAIGLDYLISADDFEFYQQITPTTTERKVFRFEPDTITVQTNGNYIHDLYYEF